MSDYLQNVGRGWRTASAVACTVAAAVCLLLTLLLWTDMFRRGSYQYEGKPLWIGVVFIALVGVAAGYMAWRLGRASSSSANGVTVVPTWFIQLFGAALVVVQSWVAYHSGNLVFLIESLPIGLAMILVGRHVAKRQRAGLIQRLVKLSPVDRNRVLAQFSERERKRVMRILSEHGF